MKASTKAKISATMKAKVKVIGLGFKNKQNRAKQKLCGICGNKEEQHWDQHWKRLHRGVRKRFEWGTPDPSIWRVYDGNKPKQVLWDSNNRPIRHIR